MTIRAAMRLNRVEKAKPRNFETIEMQEASPGVSPGFPPKEKEIDPALQPRSVYSSTSNLDPQLPPSQNTIPVRRDSIERICVQMDNVVENQMTPDQEALKKSKRTINEQFKKEHEQLTRLEQSIFPLKYTSQSFVAVGALVGIGLIKSIPKVASHFGIRPCSFAAWMIDISQHFICLLFFLAAKQRVLGLITYQSKVEYNPIITNQLHATRINKLGVMGFFTGILIGLCSSTSLVMPMILGIVQKPEISSKTSNFAELFAIALSVILMAFSKSILWKSIGILLPISFFGVYAVSQVIKRLILGKCSRLGIILWAMCVIFVSVVFMLGAYLTRSILHHKDELLYFEGVC
eukprot:TRINITY_DN8594_c0_g1_i1.p1 TRINITY_DN8594_c0_g1~~TRINITY_DN8594_c0_g1_i1.p1  ORF type:complete len:349 (+),score=22.61 TRINITY_DN8594_c0_g1_i1:337-1383(+)